MTDIVERLRDYVRTNNPHHPSITITLEWRAADEIDRLREALKGATVIANHAGAELRAKDAEIDLFRDLLPPGKFRGGDRVRKIKGSSWQGRIVGFYATTQTPEGYAVESEREPGSVQIYPATALEPVENDDGPR